MPSHHVQEEITFPPQELRILRSIIYNSNNRIDVCFLFIYSIGYYRRSNDFLDNLLFGKLLALPALFLNLWSFFAPSLSHLKDCSSSALFLPIFDPVAGISVSSSILVHPSCHRLGRPDRSTFRIFVLSCYYGYIPYSTVAIYTYGTTLNCPLVLGSWNHPHFLPQH